MDARGGALETGAIRLRGDQRSVCVIRVKRANVVRAQFHNLFEGVAQAGCGRICQPRPDGVVSRVVVGRVPGLVRTC